MTFGFVTVLYHYATLPIFAIKFFTLMRDLDHLENREKSQASSRIEPMTLCSLGCALPLCYK